MMSSLLRGLILMLLWVSGFMRLWRFFHRFKVTIVMVHGVMDNHAASKWTPLRPQLSRQQLDAYLRALSRRYTFVSLEEAVAMLSQRQPILPYSLVMTFDDGYRNQIKHAAPILLRYGVPATVFVATGHIEHRKPFWFDRLDYALQQVPTDARVIRIGTASITMRSSHRTALQTSYKRLRDTAKAQRGDDLAVLQELELVAAQLEQESNRKLADFFEEDDWSALLTWRELLEGSEAGFSFGSHTVDHVRLNRVDARTAQDQLIRSKQMLEQATGRPCHHLCYPNGDFSQQVVDIARACGYEAAVTTVEGLNRAGDDPMTLRRINLPLTGGVIELLAATSGLSEALLQFRGRVRSVLGVRHRSECT